MLFHCLFVLLALVSRVQSQPITYSFCSTSASNVAGSPALPWSVQTSAVLQLTPATGGLYQVTGVSGYRIINARGRSINQSITSVAPLGSYHSNDNLVSITLPYISGTHSIAFIFADKVEQVYFIGSETNILFKNESGTVIEGDLPFNDGLVNRINSTFTLTAGSSPSCPTLPVFPVNAVDLAAFNNQQQIPFCYSFSGGPGDGSPDQTLWTVSASGSFIVSGFAGNTTNSAAQSFIVLGVTGTRTYHDEFASLDVVNRFLTVSPASAVFSTRYPNFNERGLAMLFDSSLFYWNGNSTSRYAVIQVDGSNMFNELIGLSQSIKNVVGNIDVQTPGDVEPLQCGFEDGSLASYQFCYAMNVPSGSVVTYGQFQATGPVIRKDLPALTMQGMTGIRVTTNTTGSYTQNIIKLIYVNGVNSSSGSYILNNNVVYTTSPLPIDYFGFAYTLSTPAVFPTGVVSTNADINLSAGSSKWYEWPVSAVLDGVDPSLANGYFRFNATQTVGENYFPCNSSVQTPPMKKFYFCYQITTSEYQIQASGLILTYGADVPFQGRTGLSIANITGYRSFTRNGETTYSQILSANAQSFGAINNTYSKILYRTAPFLDSLGVVIHVDNQALTPLGAIIGEKVIDISMNSSPNLTELAFTTGGNFASSQGWMTITENENEMTCVVQPNSATGVTSSLFVTIIVAVIASVLM